MDRTAVLSIGIAFACAASACSLPSGSSNGVDAGRRADAVAVADTGAVDAPSADVRRDVPASATDVPVATDRPSPSADLGLDLAAGSDVQPDIVIPSDVPVAPDVQPDVPPCNGGICCMDSTGCPALQACVGGQCQT